MFQNGMAPLWRKQSKQIDPYHTNPDSQAAVPGRGIKRDRGSLYGEGFYCSVDQRQVGAQVLVHMVDKNCRGPLNRSGELIITARATEPGPELSAFHSSIAFK